MTQRFDIPARLTLLICCEFGVASERSENTEWGQVTRMYTRVLERTRLKDTGHEMNDRLNVVVNRDVFSLAAIRCNEGHPRSRIDKELPPTLIWWDGAVVL